MLLVFAACVFASISVPDDLKSLVNKRQWVYGTNEKSPCVAVDAYVRYFSRTLLITVMGACGTLRPSNAWCEIYSNESETHRMQKVVNIVKSAETHAGQTHHVALDGRSETTVLWNQQFVDCGAVTSSGHVTLQFDDVTVGPLEFTVVDDAEVMPVGMAVCTRLYDTLGWDSTNTVMFMEWLEWQWAVGVDVVHVYVINLTNADLWQILALYANTKKVVLHVWNDGDEKGPIASTWEFGQAAYLLDCYVRLEGRANYMAAFDHDEYIQPVGLATVADALDKHFESRAGLSNIVKIDPFTAIPKPCDADVGRMAFVTSYCVGHDNTYKRTKYFIRSDAERPFLVPPQIHIATDGRPAALVSRNFLQMIHVGRIALATQTKYKRLPTPWQQPIAKRVWEAINKQKTLAELSAKVRKSSGGASRQPCFVLIDAGAGDGDALRKTISPSQFPKSGFASVISAVKPQNYTCRHLFAFEADVEAAPRLHDVCIDAVRSNYTCSSYSGVLGIAHGVTKIYSDSKTRGKTTYSTLSTKIELLSPGIEAPMFGFVSFLRSAATAADYVVVKLDVEGSEFDLLNSLTASSTACELIDVLLVEWHDAKFGPTSRQRKTLEERYGETLENQKAEILKALKDCKVDVREGERVTE